METCGTPRLFALLPYAYTVPPVPDAPISTYSEYECPAAIRGFVRPDAIRVGVVLSAVLLITTFRDEESPQP